MHLVVVSTLLILLSLGLRYHIPPRPGYHNGQAKLLSWATNQADPRRDHCASRQVYKGCLEEVQHGRGQASFNTHVHHNSIDADEDGEPVDQKEYRSMISSLLYLTATRPDIHFAVCLWDCFQASPHTSHRQAVKRIMRYLCFTHKFGLWYSLYFVLFLYGYSDADFVRCCLELESTSRTCQFLGISLVSWSLRKQSGVAQSTTEAVHVAAASCCSQLLWMMATLLGFWLGFSSYVSAL